jgi:hypothetical protein
MGTGTKQYSRTLEKGEFHCPRCEQSGKGSRQRFKLENWQTYFTVLWIPLIPTSGFQAVTCRKCGGQYAPNFLDDTRIVDTPPPAPQ